MTETPSSTSLLDLEPPVETFLDDVLSGLRQTPRTLPCKYFYNERGSKLFDDICQLDEYYLTRTELSIMERHAGEMAEQIGPQVMLVEYGSGSSTKTRLLLDHLEDPVSYVPIDISRSHLQQSADALSAAYPHIEVLPVCADFTHKVTLPSSSRTPSHAAVYFPGSTIGNFHQAAAKEMLARIAALCGKGGGLLIGIDLQKDTETIETAYNDADGVTAQFNLNLLERINSELNGDFEIDQFEHLAEYNEQQGRVEISVMSKTDQQIRVGDESFAVARNEVIRTEYSYKYTVEGFSELASQAGLKLRRFWQDDLQRFAVLHLVVKN